MKKVLAAILVTICSAASAGSCDYLYPNGIKINVPNTIELCNSFYVAAYDPEHKAVILVSERLLKFTPVGSVTRISTFRPDPRVGAAGPQNRDYANTGWDRGHMAPAGNASTDKEMYDSFYLTNMTPQAPGLNRGPWKNLEDNVRRLWIKTNDDAYILTIAVYNKPQLMNGRIPIPSGYWKVLYVGNSARYYFAENTSIARIEEYRSGVGVNLLLRPQW